MVGHFLQGQGRKSRSSSAAAAAAHHGASSHHYAYSSAGRASTTTSHTDNTSSSSIAAPTTATAATTTLSSSSPTMSNGTDSSSSSSSSYYYPPHAHFSAEAVAALPPPGVSGPVNCVFTSSSACCDEQQQQHLYLAFVSSMMSSTTTASTSTLSSTSKRSSSSSRTNNKRRGRADTTSSSSTSTATMMSSLPSERQLCVLDCSSVVRREQGDESSNMSLPPIQPLLRSLPGNTHNTMPQSSLDNNNNIHTTNTQDSLEERLRRERQRLQTSYNSITTFEWQHNIHNELVILIPTRGSLYVQRGIDNNNNSLCCLYDKHQHQNISAIDAQLSPDASMVAFVLNGDIHVVPVCTEETPTTSSITQITFGAQPQQHGPVVSSNDGDNNNTQSTSYCCCVTHGLADFLAQEEMDRYRGYWWNPDSSGLLFVKVDETCVPCFRIMHQGKDNSNTGSGSGSVMGVSSTTTSNEPIQQQQYEDHRYPFAGQANPQVQLGFVPIDRASIVGERDGQMQVDDDEYSESSVTTTTTKLGAQEIQRDIWYNTSTANTATTHSTTTTTLNNKVTWFSPPREATEYLARADFLPDGSAWAQWQNRTQNTLVLCRMDISTGKTRTLLTERSDTWINLHHMMHVLEEPIHPSDCDVMDSSLAWNLPATLPDDSFSFLFASERTGYSHLYLYTFVPGVNNDEAILLRTVSGGEWMVESIVGVDMEKDVVYVTGTYDSPLERHLYALPLRRASTALPSPPSPPTSPVKESESDASMESPVPMNGSHGRGVRRGLKSVMSALSGATKPRLRSAGSASSMSLTETTDPVAPLRLTTEAGMHTISMDDQCRLFVDSSSDLSRPNQVKVYRIPEDGPFGRTFKDESPADLVFTLYDASGEASNALIPSLDTRERLCSLTQPEIISYPTSDGTETLHAALYKPDPRAHGPGPYPLVCAVYGGPHVQRVTRSWAQCADMRAQRLCSLGFAVVKCDNRGSSRRGVKFEAAVHRRLGRLEVLDQVTTVRQLTMRGIADPTRVGIYGWSYGGYLSAMCLCRAPDVFHAAVAGAPVTSWDGYDTHYTERYMGLPADNLTGYRESAVLDHVPNMRGHLMLVHGLIDENVHFRHTARLINRLIAAGKDYDLLIFPDERHSPRRLRDRLYMEQRISDFFLRHLGLPQGLLGSQPTTAMSSSIVGQTTAGSSGGSVGSLRTMAGHL